MRCLTNAQSGRKSRKVFDAITKDAEERHEEMTRKTRETVESGLEKAKTKAHSQAQAKIERERMLKEQEFNRTVANERTQQRARLTDKRGAITDEVSVTRVKSSLPLQSRTATRIFSKRARQVLRRFSRRGM